MVIASTNSVLFASPSLHANSVVDVIRAAKAQPGRLNYASQGTGTSGYWAIELFKLQAGLDIVHIPFNNYGQQTSALLNGDIAVATVTVPQAFGPIETGRLKPLAVSGSKRSSALPDVPTMQEAGVSSYEAATWYGLYAAGGTPKEIIATINAGFKAALDSADVKARLVSFGIEPVKFRSSLLLLEQSAQPLSRLVARADQHADNARREHDGDRHGHARRPCPGADRGQTSGHAW